MQVVSIEERDGGFGLVPSEAPLPIPGKEEVRVRVMAAGINRADILQTQGLYGMPRPYAGKMIPGLEFSGIVEEAGQGAEGFLPGDAVMGIVTEGAYAQALLTHHRLLLPIPLGLGFADAAAIAEAFLTAYDALRHRLHLQAGDRLLVHAGASGVGMAAIQIGRLMGSRVWATQRSDEKRKRLEEIFAVPVLPAQGFARALHKEAGGADAVLDLVGGESFPESLEALLPQGRLALVGLLGGFSASLNLGLVLQKRVSLVGTVLRPRPLEEKIALVQEFKEKMFPFFAERKLFPLVDRVFPLNDAALAHDFVRENRHFGKVVLEVQSGA